MEKGNALFDHGDYAEASLNYRKALQKEPGYEEAYYRLGLSELKENKPVAAFRDLNQAVQLNPQDKAAKKQLASLALGAYIADPERPKALYDLLVKLSDEWLKQDPQSMEGLRIKGYLAMVERRPDEAAELFLRAHQSNPDDEKIALGLMDALFRNKQWPQAEKVGLDFIAAHNASGDVYDALYRFYLATNRSEDAENVLIKKVKENPKEGAYLLQLASHYARARKKGEMTEALQRFVANPGSDPNVHLEAGDFYAALGDWPKALEHYNAGVVSNEKDKLLYQKRIARTLLLQNKREEGLKVLNEATAHNSDDQEARTLRAALLLATPGAGKPGEGIQDFRTLVDKNPDDTFLKFVFSKALLESGDPVGARAQLLDVVKRNPHHLAAQISLADIAFNRGDMTEAVKRAGAALEVDPNNLRAQMLRGSALLRQGEMDQAGAVLGRLSRQVPQSVDVRLQLAYLDLNKRKYGEAEAAFKKILDANPKEWRAIAGLVDTDLAQSHAEKAFTRLEQELQRSHGAPQVRYMMASTALKFGKYNVAIENLRQLADQTSSSIDPHLQLADVYRLKGDVRNAIATLQKAAILQPKDPRPANMMPFLLDMENRKQDAKIQARRALSLRPDDPEAMNNLAYLLAETGDSLDEAFKLARQAAGKVPENPAFQDTLGYVYLKRDQNDDALEIFNRLIRKYPDEPVCAYHLGMAFYQKGDMNRAKAELSRALQRRPSKEIEADINNLLMHIN